MKNIRPEDFLSEKFTKKVDKFNLNLPSIEQNPTSEKSSSPASSKKKTGSGSKSLLSPKKLPIRSKHSNKAKKQTDQTKRSNKPSQQNIPTKHSNKPLEQNIPLQHSNEQLIGSVPRDAVGFLIPDSIKEKIDEAVTYYKNKGTKVDGSHIVSALLGHPHIWEPSYLDSIQDNVITQVKNRLQDRLDKKFSK